MLSLVVQAGGESRRMGRDKGLVSFLGQPLIQRVVERLAGMADEVLVTTNRPEAYQFLGLPLMEDLKPGRGALGGLFTALDAARHPLVAVVACDMPFASRAILLAAQDLLEAEPLDAVIPKTEHGSEPFHAVYRRSTCLPAVQRALERDAWRADSWHADVRLRFLSAEETARLDPLGLAFWNINTPDELAQAEARARSDQAEDR